MNVLRNSRPRINAFKLAGRVQRQAEPDVAISREKIVNSNNWDNSGDDLQRIIDDAIRSGNYSNLGNDVDDIIERVKREAREFTSAAAGTAADVLNGSRTTFKKQGLGGNKSFGSNFFTSDGGRYFTRVNSKDLPVIYKSDSSILAGGVVRLALGIPNMFVSGISLLGGLLASGLNIEMLLIVIAILGTWFGFSTFEVFKGRKFLKLRKLMKVIRSMGIASGEKASVDLRLLTGGSNDSAEKVREGVNYMLSNDWLPQGHLSNDGNTLILTNDAYAMYQLAMKNYEQRSNDTKREAFKKEEREASDNKGTLSPEVRAVVDSGRDYIRQMQELNDRIPGVEISEKIDKIKMLTERIISRVEEHPEQVAQTKKLMKYYLPMMIKLLTAYAEMDSQVHTGDNIQNSKKQIEGVLNSLNDAFEKLLDNLYEDTAFDVASDVTVLENMLKQEGLKEQELKSDVK